MPIYIATAGWNLRREFLPNFPSQGSHLERYAARLSGVEINSSFYRPHLQKTYQRWAASTPEEFRFSVKLPREITHTRRLEGACEEIEQFASQIAGLGEKLGAVLVQLPPSLAFELKVAERLFDQLHSTIRAPICCEPRHGTWFSTEVDAVLSRWHVSRVAADPAILPFAAVPGGMRENVYFRWHGSPRMYYSGYTPDAIEQLAAQVRSLDHPMRSVWCVFDNTAEGLATRDALRMVKVLGSKFARVEDRPEMNLL